MSAKPVLLGDHDPLHLIAFNDDPLDTQEESTATQSSATQTELKRVLTQNLKDRSHSVGGLRVYVDAANGSDSNGFGTRQEPYQSVEGALRARPEPDIEIWTKKRFVDFTERFDPVAVPPNAIPISVGGYVTEYWYPVHVSKALRDSVLQQKALLYQPPSYHSFESSADEKRGFFDKLRRKH